MTSPSRSLEAPAAPSPAPLANPAPPAGPAAPAASGWRASLRERRPASRFPGALALSALLHASAAFGWIAFVHPHAGGERSVRVAHLTLETSSAELARLEPPRPEPLDPVEAPDEPSFAEPSVVASEPLPPEPEPPREFEDVPLDPLASGLPLRALTQPHEELPLEERQSPPPAALPVPEAATAPPEEPSEHERRGAESEREPVLLDAPPPRYPARALAMGLEGRVRVLITVAADGSVAEASIAESSGSADFDRAALEAIRTWRFRPGLRAGLASELQVVQTVRFELKR